jgi:hypothetical protein
MNHYCRCGREKPYRRAYACRQCWDALTDSFKAALAKARHSLRLLTT